MTGDLAFASLPMYDMPEIRPHVDRLWEHIREAMLAAGLSGVPARLTHLDEEYSGGDPGCYDAQWASRRLYFSQICGIEVVKRFQGRYRVVATPRYSAKGCIAHCYRSLVVVKEGSRFERLEDLRGSTMAVNSYYSHSGATAVLPLVAPLSQDGAFFGQVRLSGGHRASIAMISQGEADVATIDCVTYALLQRYRPSALAKVKVIGETPPAPAPPYIAPTSLGDETIGRMQRALAGAFEDRALAEVRAALFLDGLDLTDEGSYQPIMEFLDSAERHGYDQLRWAYRLPVSIPLAIRLDSRSLLGQTINLSTEGAFISLTALPGGPCALDDRAPPVGAQMELQFEIGELRLQVHGVVVRHHSAGERPGIGIRFIDLSEEAQQIINGLLGVGEPR